MATQKKEPPAAPKKEPHPDLKKLIELGELIEREQSSFSEQSLQILGHLEDFKSLVRKVSVRDKEFEGGPCMVYYTGTKRTLMSVHTALERVSRLKRFLPVLQETAEVTEKEIPVAPPPTTLADLYGQDWIDDASA